MTIHVRRPSFSSRNPRIKVREKTLYYCKDCGNRYYSYYFFCPQCLGEVSSSMQDTSLLQIVSAPEERAEAVELLKKLSADEEFDFEKALTSLPWNCMMNTDRAILEHWKEYLEAEKFRIEIFAAPPQSKAKRRKPFRPLFASSAPYPAFLSPSMTTRMREVARQCPTASAKLRWVETVSLLATVLEGLYKHPSGRVLFYDFIFAIEEQLREFLGNFSTGRWKEQDFLTRNEKLKKAAQQMQTEIEAVRQQVQEQL
jgi:hypothetical protein